MDKKIKVVVGLALVMSVAAIVYSQVATVDMNVRLTTSPDVKVNIEEEAAAKRMTVDEFLSAHNQRAFSDEAEAAKVYRAQRTQLSKAMAKYAIASDIARRAKEPVDMSAVISCIEANTPTTTTTTLPACDGQLCEGSKGIVCCESGQQCRIGVGCEDIGVGG